MNEISEKSQAQVDIRLLKKYVNAKGFLAHLDSLSAAPKIIMVAWSEEVDGPHPYLLLLGEFNGKNTYIGLGNSKSKKDHAPPMALWVERSNDFDNDDETDEEDERFENVDSSELENVIMVQPFQDCWAGLVKELENRTSKSALDMQRGAIKGLACWYLLRHTESIGGEFVVYKTLQNYLVSALDAIATTRSQSSGDRKKMVQSITTTSGPKDSEKDNVGCIGGRSRSQSDIRQQEHQLSSVEQQPRIHYQRETELPPGLQQTIIDPISQKYHPETQANNNDDSSLVQQDSSNSPSPEPIHTTARTRSSPLLLEPRGSSTRTQIAADQGFRILGRLVYDERKLAAQRDDLKRQREEIDNRISETEREIVTKRVKIRDMARGLPLDNRS